MPYRQLDDLRMYYEVHGQGTPLVMIRGLGSNLDHWYAQAPTFAEYFKVITFDNRGIARSERSRRGLYCANDGSRHTGSYGCVGTAKGLCNGTVHGRYDRTGNCN